MGNNVSVNASACATYNAAWDRHQVGNEHRQQQQCNRTHMELVRAEGFPVEEHVSVGLDTVQRQVDRDQDELALDVLVRHRAAVALRARVRSRWS